MAKFLFTVWPFPGHVNPCIAMAHALRARGHQAAFYTGGAARSLLEGEGFECFPFARLDEGHVRDLIRVQFTQFSSTWDQLRHIPQIKANLQQWLLGTAPDQIDDLEPVLHRWRPDVLVAETAFWGPLLVLQETQQLPLAVFSTFAACMLAGPDAPAWGRGLPRPRNRLTRLRSTLQRLAADRLSADFKAAVNALRRRYGLAPLPCSVTEFAGRMPLYLVPSTPAFDYQRRDLPPSVHYTGPCLWDKPQREPCPEWLKQLPNGRPVVHVTEATIHMQEPILLRASARAFKDLPMQVVMTAGGHRDPAELGLGPLADNIRLEGYVPHSDLLPRTSAVVTMGGAGTVMAALQAGAPLVIVPTEWDKPENAQRVVEAGAGLRLEPRRCTPERLRAAVQRVLQESSFKRNAQRLAQDFTRYGGQARAAELLESLATAGRPFDSAARYHHQVGQSCQA